MTKNILKVRQVDDYCRWLEVKSPHPLICVIRYETISPIRPSLNNYSVYGLFFQDKNSLELTYGSTKYTYENKSLICVAPGQVGGKEYDGTTINIGGWALLFHPDLLQGKALAKDIKKYSYFDYNINEALRMSDTEYSLMVSILRQIQDELENPHDDEQDYILTEYISLLLRHCYRFYSRQFKAHRKEYKGLLDKFQSFLKEWFDNSRQINEGIPSVQTCADYLCMSVSYFSEMIKRLTGENAGNHIRNFVIQLAKEKLLAGKTVTQTAYELGFEYPQHFSRLFKKHTGSSPLNYRLAVVGQ